MPNAPGEFRGGVAISSDHLLVLPRRLDIVSAYRQDADGRWVFHEDVQLDPPSLRFGGGMIIDGDRALVTAGAPMSAVGGVILEFRDDRWVPAAYLEDPTATGASSGTALLGSTAILGSSAIPNRVMVYANDAGRWELVQEIVSDVLDQRTYFGSVIAMDAEWVAVGAHREFSGARLTGAVYLYRRLPDGTLAFEQKLHPPDPFDTTQYGTSLALSDGSLFIGAPYDDPAWGSIHEYQVRDGRWTYVGRIVLENPQRGEHFGRGIKVVDEYMIVRSERPSFYSDATVHGFRRDTSGAWLEDKTFLPTTFLWDYASGFSLSGDMVAVASRHDWPAESSGFVHVFRTDCAHCPVDLDRDGALTVYDFLVFQNAFEAGDAMADFDADGILTVLDFLYFQNDFQRGCW
ncbi:MAG: GC-type dockerin domain-anchored protein [Phycisphaerales bacterium]